MNFIKSIFNWLKSLILWVLLEENRHVGIRYTKKALDIAEVVTKMTDSKKDDKAVAFLAKQFDKAVKLNNITDNDEVKKVADAITSVSKGSLKDVSINLDDKGQIGMSLGNIGAKYDPKDGTVKFGITL